MSRWYNAPTVSPRDTTTSSWTTKADTVLSAARPKVYDESWQSTMITKQGHHGVLFVNTVTSTCSGSTGLNSSNER